MNHNTKQQLLQLAVGMVIILAFLAWLGLFTVKALAQAPEEADYIAAWTELQRTAHEIATMAREAGLPEDSPIILECSRLWWAEEAARLTEPAPEPYTVARQVWDYLHACGLSDAVSAGIIGNAMRECGGDTLDLQPYVWGGGSYYGLFQWSSRYYPQAANADTETQLQILMDTIEGTMQGFGGDYGYFCSLTSAYDAAVYFCNYYERGSGTGQRGRDAQTALEYFTGS